MKIRLITPEYRSYAGLKESETFSQRKLTLIYIAGLTPAGFDIEIIDEDVMPMKFDNEPDLVGISFNSPTAERAYEIAAKYKELGITVVMGGFHTTLFPEQSLQHADAIVIGEAEGAWPTLLEDFKNGQLKKTYRSEKPCDLKNLSLPRYDLYKRSLYYKQFPLFATRGCPYQCSFCCIKTVYGKTFRKRPVDEIVEQAKYLKENYDDRSPMPLSFAFVDDNIWGDEQYASELFEKLIPLKINWYVQGASINLNDDLLKLAAKSGCNMAIVGFESLEKKNLTYLNKSQNDLDYYDVFIDKMHNNGIAVGGYFIVGLPHDQENVFDQMLTYMEDKCIEFPNVMLYTLIPGTPAYEESEFEINEYQTMLDSLPLYTPQELTRKDFRRKYVDFFRNVYSTPSIDKRLKHCRNIGLKYINKGNQQFYRHKGWDTWVDQCK